MSKIFDKYSNKEMVRLPQQYNPKKIDPIRFAFDKEILEALGIKVNEDKLYDLYNNIYESFNQWFGV